MANKDAQPFGLSVAENLTCFFNSKLLGCRCGTVGGVLSGDDATPIRADRSEEERKEISILPTNVPLICVSSGMRVQFEWGQITGLSVVVLACGRQVGAGGLYWMFVGFSRLEP
uniref:Uncharacterized protein n=1 Tax=Anopheles farauti TaxID=69004 RepID=A0A182QDC7_9DIPT